MLQAKSPLLSEAWQSTMWKINSNYRSCYGSILKCLPTAASMDNPELRRQNWQKRAYRRLVNALCYKAMTKPQSWRMLSDLSQVAYRIDTLNL
jgi:hypothetical protein